MKAGKFAMFSLLGVLLVLTISIAGVTTALAIRTDASALSAFIVGAAVFALVLTLLTIPIAFALDRSLLRLMNSIQSATTSDHQLAFAGPALLKPLTNAFTSVIDEFRQREQSLRNQMRELEIRHRVSEAERKQIEGVLNALRDGVLVTNAFHDLVMANERAAAILGFDLNEAIHTPIHKAVGSRQTAAGNRQSKANAASTARKNRGGRTAPRLVGDAGGTTTGGEEPTLELCRLLRDTGEAANFSDTRHVELELPTPDGEGTTVYDVTLTCVENHKGEIGGVVCILHDLTREREVSERKADFVSKASHELRTPLSSIRAYVEMLVDGEAEDEQARQEFYRIIQNETERLGRLIDNMLNISRIEAGIVQIERENVDIKQLVERAIDTLEPQAREKDLSLNSRLAAIDLTVEGDADMLYQVVLNLVSNAVKYTPEGGRVTVSADSDNLTRCVVVNVADTGLGIPPDSQARLFDKFFRVENYKRIAKGTGLGLSLCKHIVETVHRGQIGVESELGMGSKFWFSIPTAYAGSQAAA